MSKKKCGRLILGLFAMIAAINVFAMPSYDDVLVVNDNSPQSLEIGNYFKNARKIPDVNICHISVTDLQGAGKEGGSTGNAGNMPMAERDAAISVVKNYLVSNNLTDKINYIVVTRGIPPFAVDDISGSSYHLFDHKLMFELSESSIAASKIADVFTYNKYYYYMTNNYNNRIDYKFSKKKYGYYIVARLDGPGTVNIKKMIDSTGYPAYQTPKKPVKYLTTSPSFTAAVTTEIQTRGNIQIVAPDTKNGEIMRDVGQDIMFGYWNRVGYEGEYGGTTYPGVPYYSNLFYGDSDTHSWFPNIYYELSFLPGSIMTCFRSYPSLYNHRMYGGLFKLDTATGKVSDYQKKDGSDIKFRNMSCVEYDPTNNWIWCGASDNTLNKIKGVTWGSTVGTATIKKHDAGRGAGVAVFDAAGNILNHFTTANSSLLNNRITRLAYDKYAKRMWVAHYGGIQYYDLTTNQWTTIAALKNDFAVACSIYVDPYDTDRVYFSFYYSAYYSSVTSSLLTGADTSIFEYSKSGNIVKPILIDATVKGLYPQICKTSANTLWVTKSATNSSSLTSYVNYIYKYDLSTSSVIEKIAVQDTIAEISSLVTGDTFTLYCPTAITAVAGTNTILVATSCLFKYATAPVSGKPYVLKKYVLRITDNGSSASTVEVINSATMNKNTAGDCRDTVWSLVADPGNNNKFYLSSSDVLIATSPSLLKSTDQGKTWTVPLINPSTRIVNLRGVGVDPAGNLYGVCGYNNGQQNYSDFQAFGLCGWSGGLSHDEFKYNRYWVSAPSGGTVTSSQVYSSSSSGNAMNDSYSMMFMMLDGYYTAEARFAIFKAYPQIGGGGYVAHMLVFEPKCAPYAPRVDEDNLSTLITDKTTIEIPLRSPGLPLAMDSFMAATINNDTVSVKDSSDAPVTATVEYKAAGNKIVLTGDFSGMTYLVTLKCGVNGIKNFKGASLTNTRAEEFKDEITYTFGISMEMYTPPADVTGPAKMPDSNSKYDLIVSKVWWTTPPVASQPLTVNFEISNLGTAKTAAGDGIQKAKVYVNNVLVDVKSYNDIAAKGKVSLTATVPGASVTGNKQNKVMVWADATNKVTEIREINNTNSASFMIETRPDLIVKEITLSPKPAANKPLTINFKINNIGASATTAGAGVQVATVFVDGKSVGSVAYNDVPKGGSIAKQLVLPSGIATAGSHKIKVSADTNNAINEISELNNSLEKSFAIAK